MNTQSLKSVSVSLAVSLLFAPAGMGLSKNTPSAGGPEKTQAEKKDSLLKPIMFRLEKLIKQYYPRAKLIKKNNSLQIKYKVKPGISVYTNRTEEMPQLDGLMCTIEIKDGKYSGSETLDTVVNQFYYSRFASAPYSASEDKHLFARIDYPSNAASQFINSFKSILVDAVPKGDSAQKEVEKKKSPDPVRVSNTEPKSNKPQTKTARGKEKKNLKSTRNLFLWKANRGKNVVYLLGTIHVAKRSFYPLPKAILDAFNESNHLLLEIPINDEEFIKKSRAIRAKMKGTYDPPARLQDKLTPRTKKVFDEYLAWAGETWEMYDKYKPWLATSILSGSLPRRGELEEYKGRYGIDNFLSSQANQNDVKVDGLEPPDREFFAKLDESVQDTVLLSVLLDLQGRAKDLKEIFEIWKAGDLEGMVNLDADEEKEFPNLRQYNKILLDDRNIKMVERLEEFIKERSGPFFVAVGSAHMGGKLGMLQLMKDNGFEVVQIQNTRPSFEGLDLEDVSDSFKFKDGPCLDERKRLYNIIEASKKKGIGTQGYLRNLEHIESLVASGRHQYEIEPEIDRAEAALSIQVAPYVKQVITPYCIEVEKLLGEKLKGEKTLEKGPMLVCTIEADGTLVGLRKSNQDKSPAGNANLAIEKIKTIGKFPPPPKAPLRLTIIASGNPALVEAWHRGVTDTSAFVAQLQSKVRSKWKIHDFPNTNSAVSTRFRILRNGTIDSVQLVHSSGSNELDEAVFRAIQSSSPLSKLPDGSRKGLIINFTFAYVVR